MGDALMKRSLEIRTHREEPERMKDYWADGRSTNMSLAGRGDCHYGEALRPITSLPELLFCVSH